MHTGIPTDIHKCNLTEMIDIEEPWALKNIKLTHVQC